MIFVNESRVERVEVIIEEREDEEPTDTAVECEIGRPWGTGYSCIGVVDMLWCAAD